MKKLKRWLNNINWICIRDGHDWLKVDETGDWLSGGTYFYVCRRCPKRTSATPMKGYF